MQSFDRPYMQLDILSFHYTPLADTFLSKKTICLFNKRVDRALNFKEMYFANTSLSVKYNKTLEALLLLLYEIYSLFGESLMTNTALDFASYYICHLIFT